MRRLRWIALVVVSGCFASVGSAQTQAEVDLQTLKSSTIPTDTEGILEYFRFRTIKDGDVKILSDLVKKLDSNAYQIREPAANQLIKSGSKALPFLKGALKKTPLEMKRRAEKCIELIEASLQTDGMSAAARVLAQRKAPNAAEVLFNFLPSIVDDPFLEEEILTSLGRLTVQSGKVDSLILNGLSDPLPFRRAVAVYVLGRRGDTQHRSILREHLGDNDPLVRQRAAQGLFGKRPSQVLEESANGDDAILRNEKIPLNEEGILNFFRKRTLSDKDQQRFRGLVRDLGANAYAMREQATKLLVKEGPPALTFLYEVESDDNVERSRRAREGLRVIREMTNTSVPMAAAHWLARNASNKDSTAEAIRVLLAYVPFADDELVEDEVLTCLTLLNLRDPVIAPELHTALKDPLPARRAAAAFVIGHVGTKDELPEVQLSLEDLNPVVRLRAAQGLLAARDKSALPAFPGLLHQVPAPYLSRVEEVLARLSEDKGPNESISAMSSASRQHAAKVWEKWLETNHSKIDLANQTDRESHLGLITICEYDNQLGNINGQVWETNRSNQKRWNFSGVMGAMDAHTLPNGRVLVAENNSRRVTERDTKGEIKWEYLVPNNPICCQRLANGNTFIASYNMVMEVTPNKEVVYRHSPGPQFYIFSAHKARNGNIVAITAQGMILELDSKTGETRHSVQTNTLGNWCSVELQSNGNYLVASMGTNNVREIDRKGTEVWSKPFMGAFRATRLPNGNVLVASMNSRQVAEMDREGTIRWSVNTTGRPWSVRYR